MPLTAAPHRQSAGWRDTKWPRTFGRQSVPPSYQLSLLSDEAQKLLQPGLNTIAVHCHQGKAGQFIDVGIVEVTDAPPAGK